MSIISKVYGANGPEAKTVYRTKIQLPFGWRLHKFHRPDRDRAWHDHPNNFWTMPFTDYIEERLFIYPTGAAFRDVVVVRAWQWHYRDAYHTHRLAGRLDGKDKPHWTLVHELLPEFREWGFYVYQESGPYAGTYVKIPWREYIAGRRS